MATKSAFSVVGLAHKVCLAAEAQGYTPELLNALAEHPNLFRKLLRVQRGCADIITSEHVIYRRANLFVPNGWKVQQHHWGEVNAVQILLFLSEEQQNGDAPEGNQLLRGLQDEPVLNADVLDYLLAHQKLIPEEWKGDKSVYFWGTIYFNSDDRRCVRYLSWTILGWDWGFDLLDDKFDGTCYAALSAR